MPEEEVHLTTCLLKSMLSSRPSERPTAKVVHKYPIFWNKKKILGFFQDVSDRVEKDPPGGPLEIGGVAVVKGDWRGWVGVDVAADLRKYRSYSGDSVKDLLRAMRNKKHHYRELTKEAQLSLGTIPDGFTCFWLSRFPRLLLHTWLQMQIFKFEDVFRVYYDESYYFNSNYIIDEIETDELQKYENDTEQKYDHNQLFVKSKSYYDSPKHQRKKIDDINKYPSVNNLEDWRATPRPDDMKYDFNLNDNTGGNVNRQSPLRTPQRRDRYDAKRERRRISNDTRNRIVNNITDNTVQSSNDDFVRTLETPVNRIRHRKKKAEAIVTWILPGQENIESQNNESHPS